MKNTRTIVIIGDDKVSPGDQVILTVEQQYTSYQWSTTALTQTIQVKAAGIYTVTVTDSNDCTAVATKTIKTDLEHFLDGIDKIIPKAFTPLSSPGQNDGFDPVAVLIENGWPIPDSLPIKMTVYARNGEAVLKLDPYLKGGWSGDLVRPNIAEGAYYYVIEFFFPDGEKAVYKAVINLIR